MIDIKYYPNEQGPTIGTAGRPVIEQDGLYFKSSSGSDTLLPYEDWRLSAADRAKDLAARLSIEEMAGLMMYSPHQMVPCRAGGPFKATYGGKTWEESGLEGWTLTDQQKAFLSDDHVRHVLVMYLQDTGTAVNWSNQLQAYVEALPWGIPVNVSTDPRHGAGSAGAEYKSGEGSVSKWPEGMGIAATFDEEICRSFADIVAKEYRALGITTALSPQIDVATEPRWMRFEDTFGTDPETVTRLGQIYCDGLQTTKDSADGWGRESVCAMAKHWPGGGPCESGRDAHYPFGKFAVYPGSNLAAHMKPFVDGAFALDGPTKHVSAVMPYYTISHGVDTVDGKEVGNSYSHYIIHDLLREKYGYEGVVCTDWGITADPAQDIDTFSSRCYGVETLTEAERHLLAIENGVDQFGGNCDMKPIIEAYRIGCGKYGEAAMRERFERSAVRLLTNFFRCGLFDNPYLSVEESEAVVGCEAHCRKGYEAQLRSVVMLKNEQALPLSVPESGDKLKVYIPLRTIRARKNFFRGMDEEKTIDPVPTALVEQYYQRVDTPEEADAALIFVESPLSDGYGEQGYQPISLQYRPYLAATAREKSLAGGDFRESSDNRSYKNKMGTAANESDLDLVLEAKKIMKDKPVIVCMRVHNPVVWREMEPHADAILADFGVQAQAIFDLVSGKAQPRGRLPIQFPRDMESVEAHCEDVPFDMESYVDTAGHAYAYGYGLNWSGVISDE